MTCHDALSRCGQAIPRRSTDLRLCVAAPYHLIGDVSGAKDPAPEFGRPDCRSDDERILPTHTVHFVTTLVAMRSADVEHWPAAS